MVSLVGSQNEGHGIGGQILQTDCLFRLALARFLFEVFSASNCEISPNPQSLQPCPDSIEYL